MNRESLLAALKKRQKLAEGSKIGRLLYQPRRYLSAVYFRKFIYPKSKKGRLAEAPTFFDRSMQVLLPAGMDIYLLGCKTHSSELRLSRFLIKELPKDALFIDAGAHFGFYSLLADALMGEHGKVVSVEASEAILTVLQENIKASTEIQVVHAALSNQDGQKLQFTEFPILFSEYNTLHQQQFEGQDWYKENPPKTIEVNARRLDQIIQEKNSATLKEIFIKIDVEGAEYEAIQGLSAFLESREKAKLTLIMEYWAGDQNQTQHQHLQAVEHLQKFGFNAHYINEEGDLNKISDFSKLQKSENIVFKL